jgi:choline dehydrogenase
MTDQWDVIIIGAGSAGCVLAGRLSEDPALKVLLIEAGPIDSNIYIRIPKGFSKLLADPSHMYFYQTEWKGNQSNSKVEILPRGRVLGGSSAVNGMIVGLLWGLKAGAGRTCCRSSARLKTICCPRRNGAAGAA